MKMFHLLLLRNLQQISFLLTPRYETSAGTNGGISGIPFTQLILCEVNSVVNGSIPFGGVGYFDPSLSACPPNWIPFTEASGLLNCLLSSNKSIQDNSARTRNGSRL
jgi:hypothetical protein